MGYRNYATAKSHIVDTNGTGDFTTIAAALTAASSGQTIFIRPGTYTENITLKAGVNLTAFGSDGLTSSLGNAGTPNVIILGTVTGSFTGLVTISGIQLQTNAAAALSTTGSNTGELILSNCTVFANNATGMTFSDANLGVNFYNCTFTSSSTNILFTSASAGLYFTGCTFSLSGTAAASTISGTSIGFVACDVSGLAITTSTAGSVGIDNCYWVYGGTTILTTAGTGNSLINNSFLNSTTASTISAGSGTTVNIYNSTIESTNTNAITGAGTVHAGPITYSSTSFTNNATTKTYAAFGETDVFTPTLIGGSSAGTTTYVNQNGYYNRIGNLVFVQAYINISAATGTGSVTLGGLPFTIKNQTNGYVNGGVFWNGGASWTFPASTTSLSCLGIFNTTTANIWAAGSGTAGGFMQMANAALAVSYSLVFQV